MARWKTELEQRRPSPPYTRWDQRGDPVLLCYLKHIEGKSLCLSLQTADPGIAKRHMRLLVAWLLYEQRLSPASGAAKVYGPEGTERSRLKKVFSEVRRLKAMPEAKYGSEALAVAKRWGCTVGITHYLAGRKPAVSAGTFKTRRMRRRASGQRLPKGDTWEHHAQGGKYVGWNGNVLTARLQIDGRSWRWPLRAEDEQEAAGLMAPIRLARERLHQAAVESLDCELGSIAAADAAAALAGARAQLARAILKAGGPEKLADFVRKGQQEDVGTAITQEEVHTDLPQNEASTDLPQSVAKTRAERRAMKLAAQERTVQAYVNFIEANPEAAPEPRAALEKKMMKDFGVLRDDARKARAEALKRMRHLLPAGSKWNRAGGLSKWD